MLSPQSSPRMSSFHEKDTSAISSSPSSPTSDTTTHKEQHSEDQHEYNRTSFFGHLAYPISYTTSALLRRLSEDSAPTPLARALSANYNGLMRENAPVFNPPDRKHSPFQPPPLTPLTLEGYKESTGHRGRLLSKALAEEIRLLVPPRLQLVDTWHLAFSLEQDGSSLRSLYGALAKYQGKRAGFVLVVRDAGGGVSKSRRPPLNEMRRDWAIGQNILIHHTRSSVPI